VEGKCKLLPSKCIPPAAGENDRVWPGKKGMDQPRCEAVTKELLKVWFLQQHAAWQCSNKISGPKALLMLNSVGSVSVRIDNFGRDDRIRARKRRRSDLKTLDKVEFVD